MAFASFDSKNAHAPMTDINMVPLIDVMLVLLVIFIITAPLLTHAVKLDLPKASAQVHEAKPDKIEFAIDAAGALYWNGERLQRNEVTTRLAEAPSFGKPIIHYDKYSAGSSAYEVLTQELLQRLKMK